MIYLEDPDVAILLGDAAEQLRTLPDESVHMAVTSPPFYGLRDYGVDGQIGLEETPDEWAARLVEVFREVRRVLRRDGTLWLEVGDSYANSGVGGGSPVDNRKPEYGRVGYDSDKVVARDPVKGFRKIPGGMKQKDLIGAPWLLAMALRADGWYLRADIIWHRPNPMPESVTDRPTKAHSYLFLLSRSARYFYDADAIREALQESTLERGYTASKFENGRGRKAESNPDRNDQGEPWQVPAGRNKRSVWTIPTQPLSETVRTVRWVPVPSSEAGDGTRRIPSPDCPVHAGDPAARGTAPDGGRAADSSIRSERTDGRLALAPPSGDAATSGHSGPVHPRPGTADGPLLGSAPAATSHSTPCDRTGLAPASDPPCTPSDRTSRRTGDTSEPPASAGTPGGTRESRTSPDDSAARPSDGRGDRTADSPSCTCSYEKKITEETGHYAAYPEKLVEPCILAGTSEHGVCSVCGAPWERETEKSIENPGNRSTNGQRDRTDFVRGFDVRREISVTTTGWRPGCDHDAPTIPATVLDPFLGSGTTSIVARRLGRRSIGVELNPKYAELAAGRLSQQSLFA